MNVTLIEEHEDGSATYNFDMSDRERTEIIKIGILAGIKKGIEVEKSSRSVQLTPEQIDAIIVEDMKRSYRYAVNPGLTHPEDIAYYKKYKKAVAMILRHYMIKTEAEEWIESVNNWSDDE